MESPRTHHSRRRISGMGQRQRRGKGWTAWRVEKSKFVVERSRGVAERTGRAEGEI